MPTHRHATIERLREGTKDTRVSKLRTKPNSSTYEGAAQVSADKPLTEKQRAFCANYAGGDNKVNALVRAGYNPENPGLANRMLLMPNIKREISRLQALNAAASEVSRKDFLAMLKESYDMAKLTSEPATMVSAAREIGKACGYYEPEKHRIDVHVHGATKFEQLTDQELFELIAKSAQELDQSAKTEAAALEYTQNGDDE